MKDNEQKQPDEQPQRETISAKETLTLAKDVFDVRTVIKNIYGNRAVISRRLNVLWLIISMVFTLLYITYAVFSIILNKLSLSYGIVSAVLIGVYVIVVAAVIIVGVCSSRGKAKNIKRANKFLKILRYVAKILMLAISIACLVLSITSGKSGALNIAVDVVMIVISIIVIIIQTIPLLFGGIGGIARWLLSPFKHKVRFSSVALEWYRLAAEEEGDGAEQKISNKYKFLKKYKISKNRIDDIVAVLDGALIPALGGKYIGSITEEDLLNSLDGMADELTPVAITVLKSIFSYACECGYITENPSEKLSVPTEEGVIGGAVKSFKGMLTGIGKKVGGLRAKMRSGEDESAEKTAE